MHSGEIFGEGTFGKVTKIKQNNSILALKQFKKSDAEINLKGIYSVREFDVAYRCKNCFFLTQIEGIVPLKHNDERYDNYGMLMEYYDWDLLTYFPKIKKNNAKNLLKKKLIMVECLLGLEYLSKQGIFHNDIKPENILLRETEDDIVEIQICDFGLATFWPEKRACTVNYRPPEMCINTKKFDNRSDIWSLGCVFYELVTGKQFIDYSKIVKTQESLGSESNAVLHQIILQLNISSKKDIYRVLGSRVDFRPSRRKRSVFSKISDAEFCKNDEWKDFLPLLRGMLEFDCNKRLTATQALNTKFFADMINEINDLRKQFEVKLSPKKTIPFDKIPKEVREIIEDIEVTSEQDKRVLEMAAIHYSCFSEKDDPIKRSQHFLQTLYLLHKFNCVLTHADSWEDFVGDVEETEWDDEFEIKLLEHIQFKVYTEDSIEKWEDICKVHEDSDEEESDEDSEQKDQDEEKNTLENKDLTPRSEYIAEKKENYPISEKSESIHPMTDDKNNE